eukprot:jgi/Chrzof1/7641/Cz02g31090.t1
MPLSVHRRLDRITASVEGITDLVERMADYWGKELALYFIRKCPLILQHEFRTVMNNCQHVQQLIGLQTSEMALLLRKNPALLILEPVLLHSRYEALPQLTEYNQQQVKALVVKFPLIVNYTTQTLHTKIEQLRQLCSIRDEWREDFEAISPSLLAYYIRDSTDIILRLEYLAASGEGAHIRLFDVMKPSNRLFARRFKAFLRWRTMVRDRQTRQQQAQAQAAAVAEAASTE